MSVDLQTKVHLDPKGFIKFYTDHQHYNLIGVVTALPEVRYEDNILKQLIKYLPHEEH
jgi:hypothetical protein